VVAAGGVATGRGLAAVLAAGAQGAWIGTPFLVAEEARNSETARARVIGANETNTVLTSVFDTVQSIPWPPEFRGRALQNAFTARWHGRETELRADPDAARTFGAARTAEDYGTALLYAGQSVGLVDRVEPAATLLRRIETDAERYLRDVARLVPP
jgi:nitronate monooxygenase